MLCRPGDDLLSQVLRHSTIGAKAFDGRVRDGIGSDRSAKATRPAKHKKRSKLAFKRSGCFRGARIRHAMAGCAIHSTAGIIGETASILSRMRSTASSDPLLRDAAARLLRMRTLMMLCPAASSEPKSVSTFRDDALDGH